MSEVWDALVTVQDRMIERFDASGDEVFEAAMDRFNRPNWINKVWTSEKYRRAHVTCAREPKGLWMMHCCVFPHLHNPGPIFGLDVIAGRRKITGFFHDYSASTEPEHEMIKTFGEEAKNLEWKKSRDLPDWAKAIFSPYMIAAGNINSQDEIDQLVKISFESIDNYLSSISESNNSADVDTVKDAQNRYAHYQKQNPHTPRSMVSLGLSETDVTAFVQDCLFPEIV